MRFRNAGEICCWQRKGGAYEGAFILYFLTLEMVGVIGARDLPLTAKWRSCIAITGGRTTGAAAAGWNSEPMRGRCAWEW